MKCLNTLQVDTSDCLKPCSGLIVTSFSKSIQSFSGSTEDPLSVIKQDYDQYKESTQFPTGKPGLSHNLTIAVLNKLNLEYEWTNKLRIVRIYFDTPTLNIITKDRAAKPVDYVSAIGGTIGLFTGFSIISGVEIIYFAVKIVRSMFKSDENKV